MRTQADWMSAWKLLRVVKDEAVVARLAEVGVPLTHQALANYRAGERVAPLGLLAALLDVAGDDAADVLNVIAREHGLRVVREVQEAPTKRSLVDELMDLPSALAGIHEKVRDAASDGEITREESLAIEKACDQAMQEVAQVKAAASAAVRVRVA